MNIKNSLLYCCGLMICNAFLPSASMAGENAIASLTSTGEQANGHSNTALSFSAVGENGRFVTFVSSATNLAAGATGNSQNLYVRDMQTGAIDIILSPSGKEFKSSPSYPSMSDDGRYVVFVAQEATWLSVKTVYLYDRQTKITEQIGKDRSGAPVYALRCAISGNGRVVGFSTAFSDVVEGDTNGTWDFFVYDRDTGVTEQVSVNSQGEGGNSYTYAGAISYDGRYVAFESFSNNLVENDNNNTQDVFVRDRVLGLTELASKGSNGARGNRISSVNDISSDGRFVVFASETTTAFGGTYDQYSDVFVHDRFTATTRHVSRAVGGVAANGNSGVSSISDDGRYVVFNSGASNLVANDTNSAYDVFIADMKTGTIGLISSTNGGGSGNGGSGSPSISPDGRYVLFSSWADNLVAGDSNGMQDVFIHDRLQPLCL